MSHHCLYCYQHVAESLADFHAACSKKMFGTSVPPQLDFNEAQLLPLAEQIIRSQFAITGAQPKLSLDIDRQSQNGNSRFTIVGLWGNYILKPPSERFKNLPEIEDVTMHLAALSSIHVVPHSLIRLTSGKLAYITKRVDRQKKKIKLHMEDMCQLTDRLTEQKYRGSYEQIAKALASISANSGLDIVNFYEQVIFSFLTGNADMHLKNFSMLDLPEVGYTLSPAYDHVATTLIMPDDEEELALTLNGKKNKITKKDFLEAMDKAMLSARVKENIFSKFHDLLPAWMNFVDISFLPEKLKEEYNTLLQQRWSRIFG